MKIVILGSALPVRFGHPRQRIAWALRQAVASYADVVSITLDCWFSEWDARRMLLEGDHFFPSIHAKNPKELPFMSMWQKNAISLNPEHLVEEPDPEVFEQGWLNPARKEKILARIAAMDPDLVLISDPLLNGLGHELGQTGANIGWIDDALVDWVSGAAAFLHSSQYSRWMSILSAHFERTRPEALGYAPDRIAHHLHQPRPSRAGPWLHLPVEQEESELFLFKSNTLLVPSTGNWWLDRLILGWVKNWCREKQKMADDTAGLVLVGFPAEAANDLKKECGDEVEIHQDWTRLHTAIGVAQCLFVPFVTPWLQPFIEAALGVGTPVLTSASERATKDLPPQPGLYDVPKNKLVDALLNILGGGFANEETARAISEAAQSHAAVLADGHDIGTILSSWSGKTDLPRHNPPAPQWRRAPVRHDPQVLYNPITKMLLLRMELFSSAMIEEVRLLTDDGHELTRLAPSAHQKTLAHFELEGGLVTDVEILGDALRIACYRDVEEVWAARIPKHDFQYIKCGLASLEINENIADGAYWIDASMNDARQSLLINGRASPLGEDESVLFKDLGVAAVPFRTLIPKEVRGATRLALGRLSNETGHPEEMPQKALVDNYARLSRA
ncbi:MAG TPA: hypothetical protein ENK83_05195, partial [Aliiroseovarius sp.]|nr:hypothetical protein [Aliiroseovarius sp.]